MSEKYNLKIPQSLVDVFQEYIDNNPELGYTYVSEYMRDILRDKSRDLRKSLKKEEDSKERKIIISGGGYTEKEILDLLRSK